MANNKGLSGYRPLGANDYEQMNAKAFFGKSSARAVFGSAEPVQIFLYERLSKEDVTQQIVYDPKDFEFTDDVCDELDGIAYVDGMDFDVRYETFIPLSVSDASRRRMADYVYDEMGLDGTNLSTPENRKFAAAIWNRTGTTRFAHYDCIEADSPEVALEEAVVSFDDLLHKNADENPDYAHAANNLDMAASQVRNSRKMFEMNAQATRRLPNIDAEGFVSIDEVDLEAELPF